MGELSLPARLFTCDSCRRWYHYIDPRFYARHVLEQKEAIANPYQPVVVSHGRQKAVCWGAARLRADGLGLLVGVVAVLLLERVDEGDVLLLGLLRGEVIVDDLLPRALLRLAL